MLKSIIKDIKAFFCKEQTVSESETASFTKGSGMPKPHVETETDLNHIKAYENLPKRKL